MCLLPESSDAILEIGVNYNQVIQAVPYVELYRQMVIKRNRKDKDLNLDYIKKPEEIINGILGK